MKVALSERVFYQKLVLIRDFPLSAYSTKIVSSARERFFSNGPVLILDERKDDFLYKSSRNIHGVETISAGLVNAEHVLGHKNLLVTSQALSALIERLSEKSKKAQQQEVSS